MKITAREFKEHLKRMFEENKKTTWGKKELALYIEEVYSSFLERYMEE